MRCWLMRSGDRAYNGVPGIEGILNGLGFSIVRTSRAAPPSNVSLLCFQHVVVDVTMCKQRGSASWRI